MLRTSNKRLHQNLWTIAHFAGSVLCVVLVMGFTFYVQWASGYIFNQTGVASSLPINTSSFRSDVSYLNDLYAYVTSSSSQWFFPVTNLLRVVIPWAIDEVDGPALILYAFAVGLDFALWFNVLLWTLQLLVFVPDWAFHWLERKKDGD